MKKYKIIWSPIAYEDLNKIHYYIENYLYEKNIADNIIRNLLEAIVSLNYMPERNEKIKDFDDVTRNIRKMIVRKYIIIYEIDNELRSSFYFTYFS